MPRRIGLRSGPQHNRLTDSPRSSGESVPAGSNSRDCWLGSMSLLVVMGVWFGLMANAWAAESSGERLPHIVFVMADDMGWGQTGYRNHPVLQTPHLDAMAEGGLRFERFYSASPVCSPTRASVMTGRAPDRTGTLTHGYALRQQEKTIAQALQAAGYVTGHFGKWHLNGHKGPGVPILPDDPYHPGEFGFTEWVSVSNFFDVDPLMSRQGKIEQFQGDSSEVAMGEALQFLDRHRTSDRPMFAVVWYGSPHAPFLALPGDKQPFEDLNEISANHHGELVAMDRSIGNLRAKLREWGIEQQTLIVFCSDNGGLRNIQPDTVGGLRGHKGSVYEGGLRVPAIFEWPGVIEPRITHYPACTVDLFPTVADLLGLSDDVFVKPLDGISLKPLFQGDQEPPPRALPFRFGEKSALIETRYKLLSNNFRKGEYELYDLQQDPAETRDIAAEQPEEFKRLRGLMEDWHASVDASFAGKDYPAGKLDPPDLESRFWFELEAYQPYLPEWRKRWEYRTYIERYEQQRP